MRFMIFPLFNFFLLSLFVFFIVDLFSAAGERTCPKCDNQDGSK